MKKMIAVCLVILILAIALSFAGCYGYSNDDLPSKEQLAQMDEAELNSLIPGYSIEQVKDVWNVPDQTSDNKAIWKLNDTVCLVASYNNHGKIVVVALEDVADIDGSFKLQATVIEISDIRFIVQPLEGSSGFKSTEQILVPMENMAASPEPQIGDTLEIVYRGIILETDPARLTEIQSIRVIEQAVAEESNDTETALHMGVNAVILEINADQQQITVKGTDSDSVLGESCVISCKNIEMIYCHYESGEIQQITIQDLLVGDEITLNIKESEIQNFMENENILNVEQLQLATQRNELCVLPTAPPTED